jgi:hypothetical protein
VTRNIIDEDNAWREDWVRRMNEADTELREKILASYPNLTLPQLMDFIRDEIIAGMGGGCWCCCPVACSGCGMVNCADRLCERK